MYCHDHRDWANYIKLAEWSCNKKVCSVTGYSPSTLQFGRELPTPFSIESENGKENSGESPLPKFLQSVKQAHARALRIAGERQRKFKEKQKQIYDKGRREHKFKLGDSVYLKSVNLSNAIKNEMAAFHAKFKGPYTIVRSFGANNFLVSSPKSKNCIKVNAGQLRPDVEPPTFVRDRRDFMAGYGRHNRKPGSDHPRMRYNFRQRTRD